MDAVWNGMPYNEGYFGAASTFTGILGREASCSGKIVRWDELAEKGPAPFPEGELTREMKPPVLPDGNGSYAHAVAMPGVRG